FGYFDTTVVRLDVDNNDTVASETHYVNRWAPNKTVVYYLSESFNKHQNERIKGATYTAVNSINNSLKRAGTNLRIDLRDYEPGIQSGDLRYNMIQMVEDPQATGIIGYGPSAANPATGEILH